MPVVSELLPRHGVQQQRDAGGLSRRSRVQCSTGSLGRDARPLRSTRTAVDLPATATARRPHGQQIAVRQRGVVNFPAFALARHLAVAAKGGALLAEVQHVWRLPLAVALRRRHA